MNDGWIRCAIAGLIAIFVVGCGKSSDLKSASQVAVKVNADEVSVHQVNAVLSRVQSGNLTEAQQQQIRKQAVDGLIDQQLLVQQAIEKKLDRDPDVLATLESSRRQILANAYVQSAIAARARSTDEEVHAFFVANPALFAERRVYQLQQLVATIPGDQRAALEQTVAQSKSLMDIVRWLQARNVAVAGDAAVRPAEQLPIESLPKLSAMKDGEIGIFPGLNGATTIVQVVHSQKAALTEKDAHSVIEQYVFNRKRDELAAAEMKRLRDAAKITYVGEFEKLASLAVAPPESSPSGAAGAVMPAAAATTGHASVDKGLAGLK